MFRLIKGLLSIAIIVLLVSLLPFSFSSEDHDTGMEVRAHTRTYAVSEIPSEYKYVTLKENTSFAAQINQPNTIYEIRHNYNLNGKDITIPPGCVLKFEGGRLLNGSITGQNTCIRADLVCIFDRTIDLQGTWNVSEAYPEWFGNDVAKTVENFVNVKLTAPSYEVTKQINMHCGSSITSETQSALILRTTNKNGSIRMGYNSRLYNIKLSFPPTAEGVVIDDEYLRLTRKENRFDVIMAGTDNKGYDFAQTYMRKYIDNCVFYLIENNTWFEGKTALKIQSRGTKKSKTTNTKYENDITDTGIYGIVISNISFYGQWYRNLEINAGTDADTDDVAGWITDITFENVFFGCAYNNIWIHKADKHSAKLKENEKSPRVITFINCNVQHCDWSSQGGKKALQSYFCKMDACDGVKFVACHIWDWDNISYDPPFYIDNRKTGKIDLQLGEQFGRDKWVNLTDLEELNYTTEDCYLRATPYKISFDETSVYSAYLEKVLQKPKGDGKYYYTADLATIPDGHYRIDDGIATLKKLNIITYSKSTSVKHVYLDKLTTKEGIVKLIVEYCDMSYGSAKSRRYITVLGGYHLTKYVYKGTLSSAEWY